MGFYHPPTQEEEDADYKSWMNDEEGANEDNSGEGEGDGRSNDEGGPGDDDGSSNVNPETGRDQNGNEVDENGNVIPDNAGSANENSAGDKNPDGTSDASKNPDGNESKEPIDWSTAKVLQGVEVKDTRIPNSNIASNQTIWLSPGGQANNSSFPILGPAIIVSGLPLIPKRAIPRIIFRGLVTPGAKKATSLSSVIFRSVIPRSAPTVSWLPRAASLGGQLGRAASGVGFYITLGQLIWEGYRNFEKMPIKSQFDHVNYQMHSGSYIPQGLVDSD